MPQYYRISVAVIVAAIICGGGFAASIKLAPNRPYIGFIATVIVMTVIMLRGIDRRITRFEYFPFLQMGLSVIGLCAIICGTWIFFLAYYSREKFALVAALFSAILVTFISLPVCITYTLIRKRIRPLDTDNFLRCRVCEYRVDNLPGPRCPECGTAIDGSDPGQP